MSSALFFPSSHLNKIINLLMSGNVAWQPKRFCNYQFHVAKINDHMNNRWKQHTLTISCFLIRNLDTAPWVLFSGSHQGSKVLVRLHSHLEDQLGKDYLPKSQQLLGKIQLPSIVRLMSKFSSWLLPHFLGASQSLAPRLSLLPFYNMTAHIFKTRGGETALLIGDGPILLCAFSLLSQALPGWHIFD